MQAKEEKTRTEQDIYDICYPRCKLEIDLFVTTRTKNIITEIGKTAFIQATVSKLCVIC